jgi:hypothetical protein
MSKAYALQDAGLEPARRRVAEVDLLGRPHVVLVVDERYVLDNLSSDLWPLAECRRFQPMLAALPAALMAQEPRPSPSAGPTR